MTVPTVVCEIGANHRGDLATALRMVRIAARFHLDERACPIYVKFQKRTPTRALYPEWTTPHPEPYHAYGETYLEHRQALEFDAGQHSSLKRACEEHGVGYACSVWDGPAAREIVQLAPDYIKIPSACNQDRDLMGTVIEHHAGDIHVSCGMATRSEIHELVDFFEEKSAQDRLVIYACTSAYPVDAVDVCLGEIPWLRYTFGERVKGVGFSGHHRGHLPGHYPGIGIDAAAVALGATWIERHYTLDRTWRGTDHAASLEPDGFRQLVHSMADVSQALRAKPESGMCEVEEESRRKLKRQEAA